MPHTPPGPSSLSRPLGELRPGAAVSVRTRYLGSWSNGFEVASPLRTGYRVRRVSDGAVFSEVVAFEDVCATTPRTDAGAVDAGPASACEIVWLWASPPRRTPSA